MKKIILCALVFSIHAYAMEPIKEQNVQADPKPLAMAVEPLGVSIAAGG